LNKVRLAYEVCSSDSKYVVLKSTWDVHRGYEFNSRFITWDDRGIFSRRLRLCCRGWV